jgi:hypothetical protein
MPAITLGRVSQGRCVSYVTAPWPPPMLLPVELPAALQPEPPPLSHPCMTETTADNLASKQRIALRRTAPLTPRPTDKCFCGCKGEDVQCCWSQYLCCVAPCIFCPYVRGAIRNQVHSAATCSKAPRASCRHLFQYAIRGSNCGDFCSYM